MTTKEAPKFKKIRKDDVVIVTAGNSRGQTGKVIRNFGDKVVIQGVNLGKKCVKPTRTAKGAIVDIERPIHVSNVKLFVDDKKAVKLRVRENPEGARELYYREGKADVTYRVLNKRRVK